MSLTLNHCAWYINGSPLVRAIADYLSRQTPYSPDANGSVYMDECRIDVLEFAVEIAALPEEKPRAWVYELATHRVWTDGVPTGYDKWRWQLTDFEPCVPEGSIRNLTPLYARPSGLTEAERDLIREWYNATSDAAPGYLEKKDHDLAAKLGFKVNKPQGKSYREALKLMLAAWDSLPIGVHSARAVADWIASDAWRGATAAARKVLGK